MLCFLKNQKLTTISLIGIKLCLTKIFNLFISLPRSGLFLFDCQIQTINAISGLALVVLCKKQFCSLAPLAHLISHIIIPLF